MPYQNNYGSQDPAEYQQNAFGDSFNGKYGSLQPGAIVNQTTQRPTVLGTGRSGSAYGALKESSMQWGHPQPQPLPQPRPQTQPITLHPNQLRAILNGSQPQALGGGMQTSNMVYDRDVPGGGGAGGSGGVDVPPPSGPPVLPPPVSPNGAGGDALNTGTQQGPGQAPPPAQQPINPQTGKPYASTNKPPNVDQGTWDSVDRYVQDAAAQGADYWFLYEKPELVTEFRNWAIQNNAQSVDIVDYLARVHPEYPHALAGRKGSDTMLAFMQAHPGGSNSPNGAGGDALNTGGTSLVGPGGTVSGGGPALPPPPADPAEPVDKAPAPRQDPTNWKQTAMPGVADDAALAALLHKQYDPTYQQGQQDLAAILRGQAALTGDSNSGAFGDVFGRQQGRLIAQQNADFGDKLLQVREGEKNRAQQQYATDVAANTAHYQIDANKFLGLLDDDTKRYGIRTGADMEKYLGDQKAGLEKYGIQTDALMKRYIAELQLKGQTYSADKAFDADAMRQATDKYIADLNRQNQQDANNLGWGGLNVQRYGIDAQSQQDFLRALQNSGLSPEQLAIILRGFTPGTVYTPPGG